MKLFLVWLLCQVQERAALRGNERESVKSSRWRSDFAKTKIVLWSNFEDATVYMLYELAMATFWPYQQFRPNVQAIFSDDRRFNAELMGEMVVNKLLDFRSSFRSRTDGDVFLVVASSKYSPVDDSFMQSLHSQRRGRSASFTLRDLISHCYVDSGADGRDPGSFARAMAVEWNGKSLKDYNFWIRPVILLDESWLVADYDRGPARAAAVAEVADAERMAEMHTQQKLAKYMVQSITSGPSKFQYKMGLLGGNGPIAGAFAVLTLAETLLKAGQGLGHVGLELFSQSQHPMSAVEAMRYPNMVEAYVTGLSKFLTRRDIDIYGCASNTWYQNLYAPTSLSWGMAVQSGFRMLHMPRATVRKATQCLNRTRLGMIATHWTHLAGHRRGEVDADGYLLNGTGILERGGGAENVYAREAQRAGAQIFSANVDTAWDAIMVAKHGDIFTARKLLMDQRVDSIEGLEVPGHSGASNRGVWAGSRVLGNVRYIQDQDVDAVIGGCTEVGLALSQEDLDSISPPGSIAFVDSGKVMAQVLAKKALARGGAISLCDEARSR